MYFLHLLPNSPIYGSPIDEMENNTSKHVRQRILTALVIVNDKRKSDLSLIEEVDLSDEPSDFFKAADKLDVKQMFRSKSWTKIENMRQTGLVKPMH